MSDSSAIGNALVQRLGSDLALLALMPNGVYMDVAPAGSTRFVIVSLSTSEDLAAFGARAIDDARYLVKAVGVQLPGTPAPDLRAAAARIAALLEDQPLPVTAYDWMTTYREQFIRYSDPDPADPAIVWQHRGGLYRVQLAPVPQGTSVTA